MGSILLSCVKRLAALIAAHVAQSKAEDECDAATQALQNIMSGVTPLDLKALSKQLMPSDVYDRAVQTLPTTSIGANTATVQELKDGKKEQTLRHLVRLADPLIQGCLRSGMNGRQGNQVPKTGWTCAHSWKPQSDRAPRRTFSRIGS